MFIGDYPNQLKRAKTQHQVLSYEHSYCVVGAWCDFGQSWRVLTQSLGYNYKNNKDVVGKSVTIWEILIKLIHFQPMQTTEHPFRCQVEEHKEISKLLLYLYPNLSFLYFLHWLHSVLQNWDGKEGRLRWYMHNRFLLLWAKYFFLHPMVRTYSFILWLLLFWSVLHGFLVLSSRCPWPGMGCP